MEMALFRLVFGLALASQLDHGVAMSRGLHEACGNLQDFKLWSKACKLAVTIPRKPSSRRLRAYTARQHLVVLGRLCTRTTVPWLAVIGRHPVCRSARLGVVYYQRRSPR